MRKDYKIESVEPAEAPDNMDGTNWYCYVIGQGASSIRGYRQGNLQAIRESLEEIVLNLNERSIGKRGRVHIDMSSAARK